VKRVRPRCVSSTHHTNGGPIGALRPTELCQNSFSRASCLRLTFIQHKNLIHMHQEVGRCATNTTVDPRFIIAAMTRLNASSPFTSRLEFGSSRTRSAKAHSLSLSTRKPRYPFTNLGLIPVRESQSRARLQALQRQLHAWGHCHPCARCSHALCPQIAPRPEAGSPHTCQSRYDPK
jgi:hypothetical protein